MVRNLIDRFSFWIATTFGSLPFLAMILAAFVFAIIL